MLKNKLLIPALFVSLVMLPLGARATVSTTSYQIDPEGDVMTSSSATLSTTTYILDGSVTPLSGRGSSSSFTIESGTAFRYDCGDGFRDPAETCDGTDLNSATCASQGFEAGTLSCSSACAYVTSSCTTSSGGGGGGGGGGGAPAGGATPDAPTASSELSGTSFSYGSSFLLYGSMDTDTDAIKVNGSTTGVTLVDDDSWKASLSLVYGLNTLTVVALNGVKESEELIFKIYRRLVGDVTQDDSVNDYDLSKFVKLWGGSSKSGDFNTDSKVDDYDFSMLVARWGSLSNT